MRIISEFSDYYDVGMSLGQDQSLVYHRRPIVEELDYYPFADLYGGGYGSMIIKPFTIGFCGKLYKLLEINTLESRFYSKKESRATRKIAYNLNDVDNYVRKHYPKQYDNYLDDSFSRKNDWPRGQKQRNIRFYFNGYDDKDWRWRWASSKQEKINNEKWCLSFFEKHSSPIFIAEYHENPKNMKIKSKITYHAQLKPFEFYRIFDAYQSYQEISMWLSNIAVPIKPIPEVPDKIMLEAKGFDKFSFRKDPSSKKRKK